jgi:ankyrin repeat protein
MHLDPHYQVVALIEAKADVNQAKTSDGATPLCMAAQNGHADVVSRPLRIVSAVSIASRSIQALDLPGLTVSLPYVLGSTLPGGGADRGQG